jgi:hypothetical protein
LILTKIKFSSRCSSVRHGLVLHLTFIILLTVALGRLCCHILMTITKVEAVETCVPVLLIITCCNVLGLLMATRGQVICIVYRHVINIPCLVGNWMICLPSRWLTAHVYCRTTCVMVCTAAGGSTLPLRRRCVQTSRSAQLLVQRGFVLEGRATGAQS